MTLKRALRTGVAAACIVSVAAPAGLAAPAAKAVAARGGVDVRVATSESFSRIEVGKGGSLRREGSTVVLTVERDDDPDIARLLTSPPPRRTSRSPNPSRRAQVRCRRAASSASNPRR